MAAQKSLGIDLGTTMSCMAGIVNGELAVIDNRDGERITPSVVTFDVSGGQPVVGSNAILAASTCPGNFVYEVKRMFGKGFANKDIQNSIPYWPFKLKEIKTENASDIVQDNIGIVVTENGKDKVYEPIQVSACVLNYLVESAKQRLGIYPTYVVITVPAYFHEGAKQRTLDAAKIAFAGKVDEHNNKLEVKTSLLAEPTAAAIAYGSIMIKNKQVKDGDEERILVFDLGGGTYDVSILDFSYDNEHPVGIVKATDGDNFLGGSDFDNVIVQMALKKFAEMNPGVDMNAGITQEEKKKNELRLRQEAIKVKSSLSTNLKVMFNIPCYRGSQDLTFEVTRTQFERAARELFNKLVEKCKGVLLSCEGVTPVYFDDGRLNQEETLRQNPSAKNLDSIINEAKATINRVIMVGGSSRIPKVKSVLEDFFNETADTPAVSKRVISPLNPDEAIAYGAGYYANSVCPDSENIGGPNLLLIDQVPLNLNIETYGGVATKLISARTAVPCKQSQIFSTAADNQTSVEIVITQGNRPVSADNYHIGRFTLTGISPSPRGVPQIEVTFEVDQNNILKVTAMDKASGRKEIYVENMSNKLSEDDIERMKKVAEEHAKADAIFTERVNAKNAFENTIFQFQDKLDSLNLPAAAKESINKKINDEEAWLRSLDNNIAPEEISKRMNAFTTDMANLLQQGQGGAKAGNPSSNPDVEEVN